VGAGCFDRHNLSRVVQVCRQAIARWGAPDAMVSDHAGVFLALSPCLQALDIRWAPMVRGHPWQNLAAGGFSIQRRMLDAYVAGCTDRELVYRRHAPFVQDDQFWGQWAHKRTDAHGRIYYLSPEVILGSARGRVVEPTRLRRVFRLRQQTRRVRQQGQIRLHNFGLYIDPGLWGQTVEVLMYDDAVRIEQAEQLLVSYPCVYDTKQRRLTAVDGTGRQQYRYVPVVQLVLWTLELAQTVWRMPRYRRAPWRRAALHAPPVGLFESFADEIVQIRGVDLRTLQAPCTTNAHGAGARQTRTARLHVTSTAVPRKAGLIPYKGTDAPEHGQGMLEVTCAAARLPRGAVHVPTPSKEPVLPRA
jgi:hypothetical protein